jgi:hypothetical protein
VVLDTLAPAERLASCREVQGAGPSPGLALPAGLGRAPGAGERDPGLVSTLNGRPFAVGGFMVANGKIVEIDILADPERLAQLDLAILEDGASDD